MGVLNVTPDSFSDAGQFADSKNAVARAREMIAEGVTIIDIGGESTRPGSNPVPPVEQISRTVPVIEAIRACDDRIAISIDTRSAEVAGAALHAGADIINDVSALRDDPAMVDVVARHEVPVVLMHRLGQSSDMQKNGGPAYGDVIAEISAFLDDRRTFATQHGIAQERIIFDPGIGFGKRVEHNLLILKHLDDFVKLGQPVLIGASRKSFLGRVLSIDDPGQREAGSLACVALAVMAGVAIVRAHDVGSSLEVVELCHAIRRGEWIDPQR